MQAGIVQRIGPASRRPTPRSFALTEDSLRKDLEESSNDSAIREARSPVNLDESMTCVAGSTNPLGVVANRQKMRRAQ